MFWAAAWNEDNLRNSSFALGKVNCKKNKTFNFQFEALFLSPSPLFWYQKIVLQCLTSVETFISQSHILVWGLTLLFLNFFCFPVGGWWLEGQVENSPMNFFVCFKTYLNIYHTINHQWLDQHTKIWNGNDHRYWIRNNIFQTSVS